MSKRQLKKRLGEMSLLIVKTKFLLYVTRISLFNFNPRMVWEAAISGEMSAVCGKVVIGFAGTEP